MDGELLEFGVGIRKVVIFSIGKCYRSVFNHPFLVGMVLFVIFLYRSFPFLFSLLVSSSPVLVCTAVLLGTLLSFGQPNIPEIEKEENRTQDIVSLKTGILGDSVVVEREESFVVERYTGTGMGLMEKSIDEASSVVAYEITEVDKNDSNNSVDSAPLIEENSRGIQFEKRVIDESESELNHSRFEKMPEIKEEEEEEEEEMGNEEGVESQYSLIQQMEDENAEMEHHKSLVESVESHTADADHLGSSPIPPWKEVEEDEASDSGSDGAESSSPDASMADIIPMLDELHPLLDDDAPQPADMFHDGSDAASERSHDSSDSINDSDDDTENQEGEEDEVAEDDNDKDEVEEETKEGKEDGLKSVITWTEDDQKNLMNLGTSELERNQRLESLIARRRARKELRLMAEKNLIDLESSDLPFNIAPISTTRRNPFDIPYGSHDNIPGSAPSILLPRKNPFDLPYDSSEEKPDLVGDDTFQQEFMGFNPKETFFRRHESFNVGPSFFAPPKQERQNIKLRPYFVPERMGSEETRFFSFQRQSSELSESQVSSVTETESVHSAVDQEDKQLVEEELSQAELISNARHASENVEHRSESSEDVDSEELGQTEKREIEQEEVEIEEKKLIVEELSQAELISNTLHASEHVKHGSESSEGVDSEELSESEKRDPEEQEVEIELEHVETYHEMESSLSETIHLNEGAVEERSTSSLSSMSEVNEKIFDEKEDEGLSSLEPREVNPLEESSISIQPSIEEADLNISKEPVYDSSPKAVDRNLSSSTISSDQQVDIAEMGSPPLLVKRTVSFMERTPEMGNQSIEKGTLSNGEMLESANESIVLEPVVEHSLISSKSSSDSESMEDHLIHPNESNQHERDHVPSSIFHADVHVAIPQDVGENMDLEDSISQYKPSEDSTFTAQEEEQPSLVVDLVSVVHPFSSSSQMESTEEHSVDRRAILQFEQDKLHSSSSDTNFYGIHEDEVEEKLVSREYQFFSDRQSMPEVDKHLPLSDKSIVELSSYRGEELKEPSTIQGEAIDRIITTCNLTVPGLADLNANVLDGIDSEEDIRVLEHFDHSTEVSGSQNNNGKFVEETDEIKEIDEGLLLELDTVGDFSVGQFRSNLSEVEEHSALHGESFLAPHVFEIESTRLAEGESFLVPHVFEIKSTRLTKGSPVKVDEIKAITDPKEERGSRTEGEIVEHCDSELQMSESYIEHVGASIAELVLRGAEASIDLKSINDESLQKRNDIELADSNTNQNNPITEEINSGMPVVEAQSIEDIDSIFRKTEVEFRDSEIVEINSGMPVIEARYLKDTDSVVEKISEDDIEKPVVTESIHVELIPEEAKAGCFEHEVTHGNSILTQSSSELPVLEARSLEDIDLALKHVHEGIDVERSILPSSVDDRPGMVETNSGLHVVEVRLREDTDINVNKVAEGNLENPSKSYSEYGSAEIEGIEVGSSKEIESSSKVSTSASEKPNGGEKNSEDLRSSDSDNERKKAKSHKESSSSSSSSSSSDSENE